MNRSILQRARKAIFHPLVFATFPILSLFVQNMGKGYLRQAALFTAGAIVLCLMLWLLINLLIKDWERSALVVSAFLLLFFFFGHARSAVDVLLAKLNLQDKAMVLLHSNSATSGWLVLWGLLFAIACLVILRLLRKAEVATQALNLMSLALLATVGVNAVTASGILENLTPRISELDSARGTTTSPGVSIAREDAFTMFLPIVNSTKVEMSDVDARDDYADRYRDLWLDGVEAGSQTLSSPPDIYYIILDRYVRSDYLKEIFGFDNSGFLASLESRGFFVADRSRANYAYTINSLASSLNFMHLDELIARQSELVSLDFSRAHWFLAAMIRDSRAMSYLHDRGYRTMAFDTGFWFTELEDADVYIEPPVSWLGVGEFQLGLLDLTPLSTIPSLRRTRDDASRQRVLYPLEHIVDATADNEPTYVFAHIISPHDPYVFGANGEPVQSQAHYTYDEYLEAYKNQVAHINTRVVQLIDEILAQSPSPPVIIIQGDHGTCYGTNSEFDPCMGERMSILNAYYFPDQDYSDLYDDITPVNTFRIVFNKFYGTDYPLLDDRSYYSRPGSLFILTDVTDRVSGDD